MDRLEENSPEQPTETEEKPADDSNASESESAPEEQAKVEVIVEEEVEETQDAAAKVFCAVKWFFLFFQ